MFAYCGNNPVLREDVNGNYWETAFDLISLGVSVADVVANPANPWAWAGLAGDVIDVAVPFVGGVGEATRAAKMLTKSDSIVDAARSANKADYFVTPSGDVVPSTKKGFSYNLSRMESKNGKYYGKDSRGDVRVRIEQHDPTPGYTGVEDTYHCSPHFHIDRRTKGTSGPFKKVFTGLMEWFE